IGFVGYLVALLCTDLLALSRWMLVMAFDRMLPTKLAHVSDRSNSPTVAIWVAIIPGIVVLVLFTYVGGILASLSAIEGTILAAYLPVCVVAVILPYYKKDLYAGSPYKQ